MGRKITKTEFIDRCKIIHNNYYDYSLIDYNLSTDKIKIICPEHGEFWQVASSHLYGRGCPKCGLVKSGKAQKLTLKDFLKKSEIAHGTRYDYSLVDYNGYYNPVKIICSIHGEFEQKPSDHLRGHGCRNCASSQTHKANFKNLEYFLEKARKVHGDKYDYSKAIYKGVKTKLIITCPIHGDFEQIPDNHFQGKGCRKCGQDSVKKNLMKTNSEFIEYATLVHDAFYTYNNSNYLGAAKKITVTCPIHGDFEQNAHNHLCGKGCPKCKTWKNELKLLKLFSEEFLDENVLHQGSPDWLKRQKFDIYFPKYNIAIEYNGKQHYEPIAFFGGLEGFNKMQELDIRKKELARLNNCSIFYIKYDYNEIDYLNIMQEIYKIIENNKK